jgi:MFS family permease
MNENNIVKIKIALLLLASMTIMSGVTIVASLPLMSQTFQDIEDIEFLSKFMLAVPSIVIAITAPLIGHVSDRTGRIKPLYLGVVLFVLGGSVGFYIYDFYLILLGRAILGLGVAMIMTSTTALIGDYFDEHERHKFLSIQGMAVGIGGIIFITTGGFLAEAHWSYPFAIYLIPILFLPIIYMFMYEPKHIDHHDADVEVDGDKLWPIFVTAFFSMVLFYMLPTQLPYLVINELGGSPSSVGTLISVAMFINAMTAMQYAKIKAKHSFAKIFMMTFVVFGLGLAIISQAHSIAQLYFSVVFMGIGFGLMMTNVNAWFQTTVSAKQRGKASGILASSFFLGQFSSPLLFEPIVASVGIQGLFLVISIVSLCVAMLIKLKVRS